MGILDTIKRVGLAVGTGGLSEAARAAGVDASTFGLGPAAKPDANAYQYGGSADAAAGFRQQYQQGVDSYLRPAADGYRALADGRDSAAVGAGQQVLAQGMNQGQAVAAGARGGGGNQLVALRDAANINAAAALAGQAQTQQQAARDQQAGLAGLTGIGQGYQTAQTGMESAALGASTAADQQRINAYNTQQANRLALTRDLLKKGAQAAGAGAGG